MTALLESTKAVWRALRVTDRRPGAERLALSHARLRQNAVIEDADLRTPRGFDRALFQKLATCEWFRENQHLLIGGPTGVGKSWLACALGHKAFRDGFSVIYRRAPRLFAEVATGRAK